MSGGTMHPRFVIDSTLYDESDSDDDDLLKDTTPIFSKVKKKPRVSPDAMPSNTIVTMAKEEDDVKVDPSSLSSTSGVASSPAAVPSSSNAAILPIAVKSDPDTPSASAAPSSKDAVTKAEPSTATDARRAPPETTTAAATSRAAFLARLPSRVAAASCPPPSRFVYRGRFPSAIVGAQHFPGRAGYGDSLSLERSHDSVYDRFAMAVYDNEPPRTKPQPPPGAPQRGHLPREHGRALAPLVDAETVRCSAVVTGRGDGYRVPIMVHISMRALDQDAVRTLESLNFSTKGPVQGEALREVERALELAELPSMDDLDEGVVEIDWSVPENTLEEIDDMFERIQEEQLANLPRVAMPKQFKHMKLYDYQQDGIRWLHNQEKQDDAPPFFKQMPTSGKWKCNITSAQTRSKPNSIRGAVLADDMGLGKTLQTLGLLLTNPPEGQSKYPYQKQSMTGVGGLTSTPPRCTLIVCPVSVMSNWESQIHKHVNGRVKNKVLTVGKYYGPKRTATIPLVQYNQCDVLLTSYNTLSYDKRTLDEENSVVESVDAYGKPKLRKRPRAVGDALTIFDVAFHRIVLDEAHIIRSSTTGFFKAAAALQSKYKLCLTGTPFVNRPSDLHSLLAFLNVAPLRHKNIFNRAVTKRIVARDELGLSTLRTTMAYVALRRTKEQVQKHIQLVKKTVIDRTVVFPPGRHKEIHDTMYNMARLVFMGFLQNEGREDMRNNYMAFLELILRVRQSCCHSGMVPADRVESAEGLEDLVKKKGGEKNTLTEIQGERLLNILRGTVDADAEKLQECAVCFNELSSDNVMILRECEHIFCGACLEQIQTQLCPCCRIPYGPDDIISKVQAEQAAGKSEREAERNVKRASKLGRSPKLQALLDEILEMKLDEKGVVFSQWTTYLDLIEVEFQKEGYTYTRVDGTMSADARHAAMESFDTERCDLLNTPRFILCSLTACGTGINLTRGNVVFLMDPWWNAAAEQQAQDRVHRIGQTRPCRVIRFLMENSLETRMMALQETKSALGKGSMAKLRPEEKRKARMTTLKELFQVTNLDEYWDT